MIWIRADANREIGAGHVMRCLAVADSFLQLGEQVLFLTADEAAASLLSEHGCKHRILHTDYKNCEEELPILFSLMEKERPGLLLVDSYFVTERYLASLRRKVRTAYLDDRFAFSYPVDCLINYNLYGDSAFYKGYKQTDQKMPLFLLGPKYAPLREEFVNVPYWVRETVKQVLITTGGSDTYDLAGKFLKVLLADPVASGFSYQVVSGAFNPHLPELLKLEQRNPQVRIRQNVKNMAKLMQDCDLAISAGGSTLYELCAVGVPFLCFSFAQNQEQAVQAFAQQGITCYGGNFQEAKEGLFKELTEHFVQLAGDKEMRITYSRRERELMPESGATKLAKELLTCLTVVGDYAIVNQENQGCG